MPEKTLPKITTPSDKVVVFVFLVDVVVVFVVLKFPGSHIVS